jgi:F0F1-type ATP synthase membrane subunit b/b'
MSGMEREQQAVLRYKRFGGGYRKDDVDSALAELRLALSQLENELKVFGERNRELDGALQQARQQVESFREKEHELAETMSAAQRRAAEIEEGASARAGEVLTQAEEAAMRIRSEANRRIENSSAQINELLRLKADLLEAMRTVVGNFDDAISRVERGEQLFPGVVAPASSGADAAAPPPPSEPQPNSAGPSAAPVGAPTLDAAPPTALFDAPDSTASSPKPAAHAAPDPTPRIVAVAAQPDTPVSPQPSPPPERQPVAAAAPRPEVPSAPWPVEREQELSATLVELDAGPFPDFVAVAAFERSLAQLPNVEEVYVRELGDERARIELTLSEPSALLAMMEESLPYLLDVRSANRSKLVVDVAAQTP